MVSLLKDAAFEYGVQALTKVGVGTAKEPVSLSFTSCFTTLKGLSWNGAILPFEAVVIAGANCMIIHHALKSFVNPALTRTVSILGGAYLGYAFTEQQYADVPHLNPGYDPRLISLVAGVAGSLLATWYHQAQPEEKTTVDYLKERAYALAGLWK